VVAARHILLIALVVFLSCAASLTGDFILDDHSIILNNNFIKNWKNFPLIFSRSYITAIDDIKVNQGSYGIGSGETTYRPVATATYFVNYAISGLKPFAYRSLNLSLHIINAILAYLLFNLLFSNRQLALFSALFFGMHPVNAEVISCTGYRPNSLVLLFILLTVILHFKFKPAALLAFIAALFSKEIAVFLPLALAICDLYYFNFDFRKAAANVRWYILYFLTGLVYVFIYFTFAPPGQEIFRFTALGGNLIRMLNALGFYLKELIFPFEPVYIFPAAIKNSYLMSGLGLAAIFAGIYTVKKMKVWKEASFAVLWFFLWLLPLNNFIGSFRVGLAYRFLYIPLLGFALLLGLFLVKARQGKGRIFLQIPVLKCMLPFALLGYFFILSVSASVLWKNEMFLSQAAVERYPLNPLAHIERSRVLILSGRYAEARLELESALSLADPHAVISDYDRAKAHILYGIIYTQDKDYARAEQAYLKASGLLPQAAIVYTQLAILYDIQGMRQKALEELEKARRVNPGYVPAYVESEFLKGAAGQ